MDTNKPLNATDEVAAAEAELRAAQERLEAAKAKLAAAEASTAEGDAPGGADDVAAVDAPSIAAVDAEHASGPSEENEAAEVLEVVEVVEAVEVGQGAVALETVEVVEAVATEDPSDEAASGEAGADSACGPAVTETEADAAADADAAAQSGACAPFAGAEKPQREPGQDGAPEWIPYSTPQATSPQPLYGNPAQQTGSDPAGRSIPQPPPAAPFGAAPASPYQPSAGYVAPGYGQPPHAGPNAVPPRVPYGYQQPYGQEQYVSPVVSTKDHVAAGLLAIFLGWLGIHKFYLGYNTAGFIMLAVSILGGIFTVTLATWVIWIIAIIEGILYLTKSQTEFEQMYVLNKKEWF